MRQRHPYAKEITAWATGSDEVQWIHKNLNVTNKWETMDRLQHINMFLNPDLMFRIAPAKMNLRYRLSLHGWSDRSNFWITVRYSDKIYYAENDETFTKWLTDWTEVEV